MKYVFVFVIWSVVGPYSFAQNDGPKEITPPVFQKIKAEVEKLVPAFRKSINAMEFTAEQIEFSVDTFRIRQIASKRMEIDYSTVGMNITIDELTSSYDKLLNKYYNRLLSILKPADKKVLIAAQRAWIAFRDAETNLIGTMIKEEYSGGGTIQSNVAVGSYSELIIKRTVEIFNYYDGVLKDK